MLSVLMSFSSQFCCSHSGATPRPVAKRPATTSSSLGRMFFFQPDPSTKPKQIPLNPAKPLAVNQIFTTVSNRGGR